MKFLSKTILLKLYLLIGTLESAVVFYLLAAISSDPKDSILFGYSFQRLLLLGGSLLLFLLFGVFFARIALSGDFLNKAVLLVENNINASMGHFSINFISAALLVFGIILLMMPAERFTGSAAYVERLAPIIYLASVIGIQTLVGKFLWRGQKLYWHVFSEWKKTFLITGLFFGILLAVSCWVVWTGIGLVPEKYGWLSPGVPLVFAQLLLAWLIGLPFILWSDQIEKWVEKFQQKMYFRLRLDTLICLVLWIAAILIWWGEPLRKESYFTPAPSPPNYEYYPFSDAALYDQSAQNILIGADENNKTILRPLYVFFLAFLHFIGGQQYMKVVFIQIIFLASMPVLGFLLTSIYGGRPAGLLAAILIILREKNAIALTNVIEVSHSKLLMADLPVMAFMLLMIFVLIKWLGRSSEAIYPGVLAGASFGMVMLVRSSQAQLIIPVLILGMVFSGGFQLKRAFQRIMVFVLGFVIVAAPWIWRNYAVNGKPAIENAEFYISTFAGAYTEPTDTVNRIAGETPQDYSGRIKRQIFQYIIDHPAKLARDFTSYFIRNEIDSVIYLPMSLKLDDLRSYLPRVKFWGDPVINFTTVSGLVFFITLGLIALGLSISVQRLSFLGLLPLLIHFSFNFSLSLARISGWRFILPVDWILQLYYSVGLVALTAFVISLISKKFLMINKSEEEAVIFRFSETRINQLLLVFFLFLGLSLPLTAMLVPERYSDINTERVIAQYLAKGFLSINGERILGSEVKSFIEAEPSAVVLYGRALYPLFYKQGRFWGDDTAFSFLVRNIDRLQFNYIGSENTPVFIEMETPPQYFPNAADVFILGCREEGGLRALAIKVNDQAFFITISPWRGLTCLKK